jgi:hypothetical protein
MADYHNFPKVKQKENPLWKIQEFLDELDKQAKDMWAMGEFVAIDEQTIGFQGALGLKLRISYKREGDAFQCDAVYDCGSTYSFWFWHGNTPKLEKAFKHHEWSPAARRVVWLVQHIQNRWTGLL